MTFGTPTREGLQELRTRRNQLEATAKSHLLAARSQGRETLSDTESKQFRDYQDQMGQLDQRIEQYAADVERANLGKYEHLGGGSGRPMGSAGRLAPLGFPDDEMRKLQAAAQRGETCRIETRAFSTAEHLLPSGLFATPVELQHEGRVLERLPGYAMSTPEITFIRHVSTTGSPVVVGEGQVKPELVFQTDAITEKARKIAAHNGLSYEIINDWPAFQSCAGSELYRQIIDEENDQLLNGDGAGLSMTGFFNTAGILTEDATVTPPDTALDVIEIAIAKLRVGPRSGGGQSAGAAPEYLERGPQDQGWPGALPDPT